MEHIRERLERYMRRYGYGENRALRALAVAVALLLVLRVLRVLAVPVAIGAILVVGWLLLGPGFPATRETNPRYLDLPPARWWKTVLPLS